MSLIHRQLWGSAHGLIIRQLTQGRLEGEVMRYSCSTQMSHKMTEPSPSSHSSWWYGGSVSLAPDMNMYRRSKNNKKGASKNPRIRLRPSRNGGVQLKANSFSVRPLKAHQPWWKPLPALFFETTTIHTTAKSLRRLMWLLSPWRTLLE